MAEVITRFKLETTQYDSKLRDAAKSLADYTKTAALAGNEFAKFTQKNVEAARAFGNISTSANNSKDKLKELVGAFNDVAKQYNALTKEQQQSDFGKALAESMTTLKGRIKDAKEEMNSTGGVMDMLASKFTINFDAMKMFNMGLQAAKVALDVAKDAFFASEATVDEWGRTIQSAETVYQGFLNAINNGDISGFLGKMDELVRAARAAYDEMDKLNTMKTIQAPGISRQQTENERLRMMIQTGRYIAPADGRKATMQNGQLLTPEQIKTIERMLQGGLTKMTDLVKNEVDQTGKAIGAYYNSLAKQNGMSLQEFKKGTSTWEEFSKKIKGYEEYKKWDREARAAFARQGGQGNVNFDKNNPYLEYKKWGTFRVDKMGENSYNELVGLIKQRDQQASQIYSTFAQSYRAMNRVEGTTLRSIMGGGGSGSGRSGGKTTKTPTYDEDSLAAQQAEVRRLTKLWQESSEAVRGQYLQPLVDAEKKLQQMTDNMTLLKERAKGFLLEDLMNVQTGVTGVDKTGMGSNAGVVNLDFKVSKEELDDFAKNFADATIKAQKEAEKEANKTKESPEYTLLKDFNSKTSQMVGGLQSVNTGLRGLGLEIPKGVDELLNMASSMMQVMNGLQSIIGVIGNGSLMANTAAINANTYALMMSKMTGGLFFGMAGGGIVPHAEFGRVIPGNSFSGDNVFAGNAWVNSGELVLNRSEQGVLASLLDGGGSLGNLQLETRVDAEDLIIMLNSNGLRRGLGRLING